MSGENVKTIEGHVYNVDDASFSNFRDTTKNHLVMTEANIDVSINRKRICVLRKKKPK